MRGCVEAINTRTFVSNYIVLILLPKYWCMPNSRETYPPLSWLTCGLVCHEQHSHRPSKAECHGSLDWMVDQYLTLVRALDPARVWTISLLLMICVLVKADNSSI